MFRVAALKSLSGARVCGSSVARSAPSMGVHSALSGSPLRAAQLARQNTRVFARSYAATEQPPKDPKIRYFVAIALVVTGMFVVGVSQRKGTAQRNQLTDDQVEALKARPVAASAAFKKEDVFVVFVLGGPGSGKGTQCANIVKDYKFAHLSAGDLLRAEQQREGSKYGQMIADYIKSGRIVPQEVTIALLEAAMSEEFKKGTSQFLIDGFPRKMDQALTFEETVAPSKFTLFFECPEQTMLDRLLKRGETSGRADDNIESIKKRFKVFVSDSLPVVNYFDIVDKVARLQCTETPDNVYAKVRKVLDAHGCEKR